MMTESNKKYRILFVCLGNICRSPAAQGVMQRLVDERGLHIGESRDDIATREIFLLIYLICY